MSALPVRRSRLLGAVVGGVVAGAPVVGGAAEALAPGGRLLVVARDRTNLDGGWGRPRSPEVQATAAEMRAMLEGIGLRVARAERVNTTAFLFLER